MSDRQAIHDSRAPIKRNEIDSQYAIGTSLGVVAGTLYHHGFKKELVDIEWEEPHISTHHAARYVEIDGADVQVRVVLLEIADKCRLLAAELIEHADRLEGRAGDEIAIAESEGARSESTNSEHVCHREMGCGPPAAQPTPALGKPVRDMLPLQLPEQEMRRSVRGEGKE